MFQILIIFIYQVLGFVYNSISYVLFTEIYITGILRRKSKIRAANSVHNGQLYCQNMNDIKQLAKRYNVQYTGNTIEENLQQAFDKNSNEFLF